MSLVVMRNIIIVLFAVAQTIGCSSSHAHNPQPTLVISAPTIEQEAESIFRTIRDIEFLEQQGYQISLPKDQDISVLIQKSKNGKFGSNDYPTIVQVLQSKHYREVNYTIALEKVSHQKSLIEKMISELEVAKKSWKWNFKTYRPYKVVFTLYGTGGSYNPDNGTVTLMTDVNGKFKRYLEPANTIIHEIVHIGIEESLVEAHKLSHPDKERLVDTIVFRMFSDELPNYTIQNMGNKNIDRMISSQDDLRVLPTILTTLASQLGEPIHFLR